MKAKEREGRVAADSAEMSESAVHVHGMSLTARSVLVNVVHSLEFLSFAKVGEVSACEQQVYVFVRACGLWATIFTGFCSASSLPHVFRTS